MKAIKLIFVMPVFTAIFLLYAIVFNIQYAKKEIVQIWYEVVEPDKDWYYLSVITSLGLVYVFFRFFTNLYFLLI